MPGDRRKSDSRRNSERRFNDRRKSDDRRTKDGRRTVDGSEKSASGSEPAGAKGSGLAKTSVAAILKRLAMLFMMLMIICLSIMVYFFSHFDYYMEKVGRKVRLENTSATVDSASLTGRTSKASVTLKITNDLPFPILIQNLAMNVKISGYIVAKGVQVMPKEKIESGQTRSLQVRFQVDSIMARRGLQKAVEKNTGPILKSLISKLQGKNDALTENLAGLMTSQGTAEMRMIVGGVEIPFKRNFESAQGS